MDTAKLRDAIASIWESARLGRYYPPEWQGRLSMAEAYRVQLGLLARHLAQGERQAGWKVGLTAKAMQVQAGIHEPVFGFLLEGGARPSGTVFRFADLIRPALENELCLTIGSTLRGPGVTVAAVRAALAAAAPALEIVERRGDAAADVPLSVADNCQQKAFVTGAPVDLRHGARDLGEATVEVVVNGISRERAPGSAVMGDPAASVAWLANKLAEFGLALEGGMRILSGSFTAQYALSPGDRVESRFQPFGAVSATFE